MERGNVIHKISEQFVKGETKTAAIPEPLKKFADLFKSLRKEQKKEPERFNVETTWAFRADWTDTTWNDWSGCWLRVKVDLSKFTIDKDCITIDVYDWKTGKFSPQYNVHQYMMQQHLYGTAALQRFARLYKYVIVRPHLVFLDAGEIYPPLTGDDSVTYIEENKKDMVKEWTNRVKPMLNDSTFKATPGNACKWCHFKRSNGGPCQYGD